MSLRVDWLDVFTDMPFAGNPLAVLPDADGLDDAQMQTIAAELGLSETVFVHGGAELLRIFTPTSELPLAGHPVVGTTHDLVRLGRIAPEGVHVFETGVGATAVETGGGLATMTQAAFDPGRELDPAVVAALIGLEPGQLAGTPRLCSTTGVHQALVRVPSRAALRDLVPTSPRSVRSPMPSACSRGARTRRGSPSASSRRGWASPRTRRRARRRGRWAPSGCSRAPRPER